ncbi:MULTISPECIES: hypothetical protein [Bradyrhizobium]|uniref:Uncharacterized protein n=1 Tax=Bradyrhizobium brasilense TaxID=1419277 RepID=A0ABY8JGZ5_9BRAD|nr:MULTISPECIES: hypothetical protein [Bradyrhizobium]MCP1846408.1 hypothetical protein [Bradyrhizobium sp. USDA 4541]MCP1910398.1 hypothetical protein [Bradyrhizobium elkanii]WFU63258.1 hypothetical protein QA636_38620 [Bradyrhizobium brasilense]
MVNPHGRDVPRPGSGISGGRDPEDDARPLPSVWQSRKSLPGGGSRCHRPQAWPRLRQPTSRRRRERNGIVRFVDLDDVHERRLLNPSLFFSDELQAAMTQWGLRVPMHHRLNAI